MPHQPGAVTSLLLLALLGCERPFEPLQPSDDISFSIYGYLDASVDTQWVRVMPIRDLAATSAASIDMTVRLEHLGSGESVELRDSLFAFPASNIDPTINRYARNFWTTEKMEPGASYRVLATRSDGTVASATARVPKAIPEVVVGIGQSITPTPSQNGFLRLPGAEYVAMVNIVHLPPCLGPSPPAIYQTLPQPGSGDGSAIQVALIRELTGRPGLFPSGCAGRRFRHWDIYFVLTGSPWPFDPTWTELEAFLVGAGSNVTNGTGFLGGVITRTLPFEQCYLVGGRNVAPFCELTYNARSASVSGFVTDRSCPNDPAPLEGATVFVWENAEADVERTAAIQDINGASFLLRKPNGVKVRTAYTKGDGSYRIGALEEGVPYAVSVVLTGYQSDEGQFELQAGQQSRLDLGVTRPRPNCGP